MWRCSGARRSVRPFFGADRGLCFDSPHLHHPTPGFRWKSGVFVALTRFSPLVRPLAYISGCVRV
nr:MAG TPA: hypothetical protein [Caudoviricetes sp.]